MPQYLSPGVYIEERVGPQPIQGVGTNTVGMVGVTKRGPTEGKPQLVTSFGEFVDVFGGYFTVGDTGADVDQDDVSDWVFDAKKGGRWWTFPYAVKGFFDNGGQRLFVKRVVSEAATRSTVPSTASAVVHEPDAATGLGVGPAAPGPLPNGTMEVLIEASSPGTWGDAVMARLIPAVGRSFRVYGPQLGGRLAVRAVAGAALNGVDLKPAPAANGPVLVQIGGEYVEGTVAAGKLSVAAGQTTETHAAGSPLTVLVPQSVAGQPIALELDGWTAERLAVTKPFADVSPALLRVRVKGRRSQPGIEVLGTVTMQGDKAAFTPAANEPVVVVVHVGDEIALVEAVLEAEEKGGRSERFGPAPLQVSPARDTLATIVTRESKLVRLVATGTIVSLAEFPAITGVVGNPAPSLAGGEDHNDALAASDFAGTELPTGERTGVAGLEDVDEIAICAVPGLWNVEVHNALINHCELLRDRFAILDPKSGLSVTEVQAFRQALSSEYAALYHPWLHVADHTTAEPLAVPPSGHVAGVYARTDDLRGVHKSPANEVVRSVLGLVDDINRREQDLLNPIGINAIRTFPNRGIRIWGGRTLADRSEWRYVSVRRLFIFIEESIQQGTQWVVFEPNNEDLWARVRQSVSGFLRTQWRNGALLGATEDEAFFVVCDRRTMTQDDLDNGRLIVEVGISPVRPAEFVIFRFQQKTLDQRTP